MTRTSVHAYRDRVKGVQPGLELYLLREAPPPDAPVYVFQHTMKTGGTAFRTLLYQNVSPIADLELHDVPKRSDDLRSVYTALAARLEPHQLARMHWAAGHTAGHLLRLIERPVRPVTIVRDPVDRTLSRYFFGESKVEHTLERLGRLYDGFDKKAGARAELGHVRGDYVNPQSRTLLEPRWDIHKVRMTPGPPPDADLWRDRLIRVVNRYRLLVQERLDDSVALLARELGWTIDAIPTVRVNEDRPTLESVDEGLCERIRAYNWLDVELHAYALAQHDRLSRATRPKERDRWGRSARPRQPTKDDAEPSR